MLKYVDTLVTFSEIPDEITLCVNISGCKIGCKGCHSPYLSEDKGYWLTHAQIDSMCENNKGITCICFMGGDHEPETINEWAKYINENYPKLRVGWYSGKQELAKEIDLYNFDFIKLGPYKEDKGPLNNPDTNQRFYHVVQMSTGNFKLIDVTYLFWNKNEIKD